MTTDDQVQLCKHIRGYVTSALGYLELGRPEEAKPKLEKALRIIDDLQMAISGYSKASTSRTDR